MNELDFSWVEDGRQLEVEAIEGGRPLSDFAMDPGTSQNEEEMAVMGQAVDDAEEVGHRVGLVKTYVPHAGTAYMQRGLVYPFRASDAGDALEVVPGQEELARAASRLRTMASEGAATAKQFESRALVALHRLVGGWGACVGAPRESGEGPEKAIRRFRDSLEPWERGNEWPKQFAANGDNGADGFVILGRGWGGPIIFYQAKNSNFDLRSYPEEFARQSEALRDWFGRRWNQHRVTIPVLAVNTVLTMDDKDRIAVARGEKHMLQMFDAVDILCAELTSPDHPCRLAECRVH